MADNTYPTAWLKVEVARANDEQALITFETMDGPYSVRVPMAALLPGEVLAQQVIATAVNKVADRSTFMDVEEARKRLRKAD